MFSQFFGREFNTFGMISKVMPGIRMTIITRGEMTASRTTERTGSISGRVLSRGSTGWRMATNTPPRSELLVRRSWDSRTWSATCGNGALTGSCHMAQTLNVSNLMKTAKKPCGVAHSFANWAGATATGCPAAVVRHQRPRFSTPGSGACILK